MRDTIALLAAVAAVFSCELPVTDTPTSTLRVVQLFVVPESLSLDPQQQMQFAAYGRTVAGDSSALPVTWAATGGTITSSGMFVAGTAPGDYAVRATNNVAALTASSRVHISGAAPVASVSVAPGSSSLTAGQTLQLMATLLDASGASLTGRAVTWVSGNSAIATVSGTGLVAALATGSVTITATSEGKSGTAAVIVTQAAAPVATVSVAPAASSVAAGQTVQLAATLRDAGGNVLTGRAVTWSSSNTGVVAVNGNGLVTGVAAGSATITATSENKNGTAGVTVTQPPAPVASVAVSPASASVTAGQTVQLAATPRDAGGNALTGRVVTWSSGNAGAATVNGSGLVTGVAAGSATITATSEGKAGTAVVTVTPPPVASVTVSPASASVATGQTVQLTATPRDGGGNVLAGRVVTWASSNSGVAGVSGNGLVTAAAAGSATITATSEGKTGTASVTVTASGTGTVLVQESFEDNNFASRGWYDDNGMVTTTAQHASGSTRALEAHYTTGAMTPPWGAARHLFPATATLYVSFWVKYSDNWVGSGKPYHPHEFMILSDLDGDYNAPATAWLNVYIEHVYQNGGVAHLAMQDSKAINTTYGTPPVNLVGVTESRSTSGCNGVVESGVVTSCFSLPPWFNDKELIASQVSFQPSPGPGYKGNWNHVEVYLQMNSIVNGIGQADGVMQYWFNGTLVIDRHDILLRTGARPTMKFHQFMIAPYIGDGSPVDQYMWVDDLVVATAKP